MECASGCLREDAGYWARALRVLYVQLLQELVQRSYSIEYRTLGCIMHVLPDAPAGHVYVHNTADHHAMETRKRDALRTLVQRGLQQITLSLARVISCKQSHSSLRSTPYQPGLTPTDTLPTLDKYSTGSPSGALQTDTHPGTAYKAHLARPMPSLARGAPRAADPIPCQVSGRPGQAGGP